MLEGLNPQQRRAVEITDRPLLVIAGAGSGKTRVITEKIAYLIEQRRLPPRNIVAITFTNKAAREMQERLRGRLAANQRRGLTVSTFHTFGLRFLRAELKACGRRSGFSILDAQDTRQLLSELVHRRDDAPEIDLARNIISGWKNDGLDPGSALACAETEFDARIAQLFANYEQALVAYNAVDFDDLIRLPVAALADSDLRDRWQQRIRHLLVDEYQDTNGSQYKLVRLLAGAVTPITVVGDDDQSIYAWRGARPENLARLAQDFPRLETIALEQNYRSTETILDAANALIANNPHVFDKRLWSQLGTGEPIRVLACDDEADEAARIVAEIQSERFRTRRAWSDFAILYRSNFQARSFEKLLREQDIPYRVSGGTGFFEYQEVKDLVGYLRLIANPDDDPAFLRIINTPRREIGPATLAKLGHFAATRGCSLARAAGSLGAAQHLDARAHARLNDFADRVAELRHSAETTPPAVLAYRLVEEFGLDAWLIESSPNPKAGERRIERLREFIGWIDRATNRARIQAEADAGGGEEFVTLDDETPHLTLAQLLARISLADVLERRDDVDDRVQLMTLHTAKGLEFPVVFLVGFEEELLPHAQSIADEAIEEERRLAYVGITRARERLFLSHVGTRRRAGEDSPCEPSRFLSEIPAHLLAGDPTPGSAAAEQTRELTARAHLAGLKALLSD
ncbi:MAG: UvrD-helicase domain-containing protein [Thioalkalivibrionaceae bacterium]